MVGLQDILENEDVKLDNMFVTSLVTDIIKVRKIVQIHKFLNQISFSFGVTAGHTRIL